MNGLRQQSKSSAINRREKFSRDDEVYGSDSTNSKGKTMSSDFQDFFSDADIVFRYTRKQAMRDGVLVDCTNADFGDLCRQLGIRVNVAMTSNAWGETIGHLGEPMPPGQSIEGRLWDVLYAFRYAIAVKGDTTDRVHFKVGVQDAPGKRKDVALWSLIGPGDEGEPVITIMLEGED